MMGLFSVVIRTKKDTGGDAEPMRRINKAIAWHGWGPFDIHACILTN
jgi:hypothetical protein